MHYGNQGFLVDWDAQKAVWDGLFSSEMLAVSTSASHPSPLTSSILKPNLPEGEHNGVFPPDHGALFRSSKDTGCIRPIRI